ncbi:MAG: DNA cytosine methyltransferase [Treponema sp.]|jgi:DNA (cytosine-5)-methyltransferase 1|nr:DNA cytosine methyltransferase [Treponema sp.]
MKVVSLFSGAGGLDLGFLQAGHTIVWANDLYSDAVETYRNNIGNHIVEDDIHNIASETIPDCDIVIGGFPCQGFSVANTKRTVADRRNELYKQMIRVIKDKQPLFFLAENVKGLLNLAKGSVIKIITEDFTAIGYKVKYQLLNAADYGVPQLRQRVIIVGVREDINFDYVFSQKQYNENGTDGVKRWVSVKDALQNLPDPDKPNALTNHEYSKYKIMVSKYLGHRLIDGDKPAPTVTARGDERGGVVVLHHYNNQRRMSCRELATIQSFPLDFTFSGTRSSVYRQIANAVPPILAYTVAKGFNTYKGTKNA